MNDRVGLAVGVDGGNSKTIALVGRLDGSILGFGRSGCSDIYACTSPEAAMDAVHGAIREALARAGATPADLIAGAFSMAGADWPEDFDLIATGLKERGPDCTITVVNDAMGALRAGSPDGTGVVVTVGTGAAIGARSPTGRVWHTSWWQEPQGSRHLTSQARWAVYKAALNIETPTSLTRRVLEIYGQETVEDVLHLMTTRGKRAPDRVAQVTRALLEEAERGDEVAARLVRAHGRSLGDYALAAARNVGIARTSFPLVLTGGVLRHEGKVLRDAIVERVHEDAPEARPIMSRFEPAIGAFFLALEAAGAGVDASVICQARASLPPKDLFET